MCVYIHQLCIHMCAQAVFTCVCLPACMPVCLPVCMAVCAHLHGCLCVSVSFYVPLTLGCICVHICMHTQYMCTCTSPPRPSNQNSRWVVSGLEMDVFTLRLEIGFGGLTGFLCLPACRSVCLSAHLPGCLPVCMLTCLPVKYI